MKNDLRREAFVRAANDLFSTRGIAHTSIQDITEQAGVTRSLFYHYFENKQSIIDAVIDYRVDEYFNYIIVWSKGHKGLPVEKKLVGFSHVTRGVLQSPNSLFSQIVRERDSTLYHRFAVRCASVLAAHFVSAKGQKGSLIELSEARYPKESFYVLAVGIVSLILEQPDTSDQIIASLIADALQLRL